MNQGINTFIKEFKEKLTEDVNGALKKGLPIAVVDLALDNIIMEVKGLLKETLEKEKQQQEEQPEQIKYEEQEVVENVN